MLADAGYGIDTAFRNRLSELGLPYVVGITSAVVVWYPGIEPLPPKRYSGKGRPPVVRGSDRVSDAFTMSMMVANLRRMARLVGRPADLATG